MDDVSRTAAAGVDAGPVFAVTVCSDALRSGVTLRGELDLASAPHVWQVLEQLRRDGVLGRGSPARLNALDLGPLRHRWPTWTVHRQREELDGVLGLSVVT
ncbi:MAG: hypothetical protein WAK86_20095 [Pseudonocardiaceae bacterium]